MRKIKVAVIGVGHLGSIHARIYRHMPEAKLVAISDINHSRLKEASRQLGVPGFADYNQLFGKIDAVSIATPTRLHYKVGRDCLREKISALIEKPFTSNLTQADELIKLAKKNKLTLQVGHIERFNSAFVATRKLIKNPRFIECHRLSPFPYRSLDVGVVLDLMIHDIDIVLGLVKSKIRKIDAVGINVLTPFEDIASARLEFSNGCVCNLTSSRISDDVMRKIRIFLADSYISLDYKNEDAFVYKRNKRGISKKPLPIEREPSLRKELADFLKCVKNKSKPIVCGEAARQALAVAIEINNKIWRRKN
ncbi:MAG: Gfo/Idh/MocA family oxidoreductase [Candidatus Omnitrophica bacterium]|nr:Gfo/Idh/MocA family oxidoreductase [Candidatus Omnitrophota bacterium]